MHAVCISLCTTQRLQCGGRDTQRRLTCTQGQVTHKEDNKLFLFSHISSTHPVFTCICTHTFASLIAFLQHNYVFLHTEVSIQVHPIDCHEEYQLLHLTFPVVKVAVTLSIGQHSVPLHPQSIYKWIVSVTGLFLCSNTENYQSFLW